MTRKLKYLKSYRDRHGKERHYFRSAGSPDVPLPGAHGSKEFMEAYWALREAPENRRDRGAEREIPGSISALIARYYQTKAYQRLGDKARRSYRGELERLREKHGKLIVRAMKRRHVVAMLDAIETSGAEYNQRRVLRLILNHAVELGWIEVSPMQGMRRERGYQGGFVDWSDAEISQYEERWTEGTRERLALHLLLYTAQRRGDVVVMGRQHTKPGKIHVAQAKSGGKTRLWIPIHWRLAETLASVPADQLTFLLTSQGKPFTSAGFGNWFGEAARAAGLIDRTAHGLRKAGLRRLAQAGCTPHQLRAISGHKNLSEVTLYTDAVDQERLAEEAIAKVEPRTELSTPEDPGRQEVRKVQ